MIKCAFCSKVINVRPAGQFQSSGPQVDTKYWKGDGPDRRWFCDAKCSLDSHEKERALINVLGDNNV